MWLLISACLLSSFLFAPIRANEEQLDIFPIDHKHPFRPPRPSYASTIDLGDHPTPISISKTTRTSAGPVSTSIPTNHSTTLTRVISSTKVTGSTPHRGSVYIIPTTVTPVTTILEETEYEDRDLIDESKEPPPELPTYEQFCAAVDAYSLTRVGGHPPKPKIEVYQQYQDNIARHYSIKEQAMLLANIVWESGGLQYMEEIACHKGNCEYGRYYGRGYIQLTWDYNYREASRAIYGDDRLLKHPERVAKPLDAWRTTHWYWHKHVHHVLVENDAVENYLLGYSIMAINGRIECQNRNKNAKERLRIYNGIINAWKLGENEIGSMEGCLQPLKEALEEKVISNNTTEVMTIVNGTETMTSIATINMMGIPLSTIITDGVSTIPLESFTSTTQSAMILPTGTLTIGSQLPTLFPL